MLTPTKFSNLLLFYFSILLISDDCDPFINEYGCLSIIQKDDIYIKIIDTDSKYRGEKPHYKRIEKYNRKSKRKRKKYQKYRKRKQNNGRNNKRDNKNTQKGSSSVNGTSKRKQCQTGAGTIEVKSEKCTGNSDLNPTNLESKLPKKYWTVPKFVLELVCIFLLALHVVIAVAAASSSFLLFLVIVVIATIILLLLLPLQPIPFNIHFPC